MFASIINFQRTANNCARNFDRGFPQKRLLARDFRRKIHPWLGNFCRGGHLPPPQRLRLSWGLSAYGAVRFIHYCDAIMGTVASQVTSLTIVYTTVYSDADQSKHQSSASLAFVWGIHRGPVNSPHKWPVTRKMFYHLMTSSCHNIYTTIKFKRDIVRVLSLLLNLIFLHWDIPSVNADRNCIMCLTHPSILWLCLGAGGACLYAWSCPACTC